MKRFVSQAAFARQQGVSRQRVHQWLRGGIIQSIDGKIDSKKAIVELERNLDHGRRIDWELETKNKSADRDDLKLAGLSGNPIRDLMVLCLVDFLEKYCRVMMPILRAVLEAAGLARQDAKELGISFFTRSTQEVEEFIKDDRFGKTLLEIGEESLDSLWAVARQCPSERTSLPKNFQISLPSSIMELLDEKTRKSFQKISKL